MLLKCPICGSTDFYVDRPGLQGNVLFFELNEAGEPKKTRPEGIECIITPDETIYCVGCSWSGTVSALISEQA